MPDNQAPADENEDAGAPLSEDIEEAGEVEALQDIEFEPLRHRAETARALAYILVGILGGSILIQYISVGLLTYFGKSEGLDNVSKIFNAWLPIISGLVSSAATYYFTRDRDHS